MGLAFCTCESSRKARIWLELEVGKGNTPDFRTKQHNHNSMIATKIELTIQFKC